LGIAQKDRKEIPLKNILGLISKDHQVRFSYIEDEIVVYALTPPDKNWSLEEKINYLKRSTRLQFKRISDKYFTIYDDKKLDKPLCGFLIDAVSGKGIENALIKIEKTDFTTFTEANGHFTIPKISSEKIQILHQGYQTFSISPEALDVPDCPKFQLQPILQNLDEVITQRYLTTGISKKNDGTIVIKPKKFGLLPGLIEPDVLQTMQQIPGIISIDETISNINVRGGTHDQNLFLWNGIRMFQTGHFFGLISAFNPSLAQNITISKNGSSAFFGESVSSLVDISSQNSNTENTNVSLSSNMISAELYAKVKISDNSNFTFSSRRSLTDIFQSPTYRSYSNRIFQNTVITDLSTNAIVGYKSDVDFYFYDITAQLEQKIGTKHQFNIDVIAIENTLQFNQSTATLSKNSALEQESFGGSLQWKTNWNEHHNSEFKAYFSAYDLNSTNQTLENNQTLAQKNKVLDFGFQVRNTNRVNEVFTLNTGYQLNEIGVTNFDEINLPFFSRTITNVLISHALITEGVFETENKKTFIRGGIRANYFDKFVLFLVEPRLQFNQALGNQLRLEILGEQKSQTLSQITDLQQDFLGVEKRRWTLANNESIPVQKSNQLSVGLSFKKNNWLITVDHFYKKITGITSSSQGFLNQFESERAIGNYRVLGSEFLIQKSYNRFYTWLSYAYNDNKYDFETLNNTPFPNNFEVKHAFSWAAIYEWEKVKLALGAKWHTGRPITTPTNFTVTETNPTIIYNAPNNEQLKDYFQVNFSASKEWHLSATTRLQTSVSILNLLNKQNSINRFYRVNTTDNTVESVDTYSLRMTPNFNIKFSF
jgi:hypothetical protein